VAATFFSLLLGGGWEFGAVGGKVSTGAAVAAQYSVFCSRQRLMLERTIVGTRGSRENAGRLESRCARSAVWIRDDPSGNACAS